MRVLPARPDQPRRADPHQRREPELRPRRHIEGFNLAFIDIMSCGLGAIILVFMLIKDDVAHSSREAELLQADLARLQTREEALAAERASAEAAAAAARRAVEAASGEAARAEAAQAEQAAALASRREALRALERTIEQTEVPRRSDVVESPRAGEETYLVGLRVEGPKIGILVDASASMTDEVLIDIIRRKNAAPAERRDGPKWQRTRRVVEWLLARVPEASQVSVVAFSGAARPLGGPGWVSGADGAALARILDDLAAVVPEGATNLQTGLDAMAAAGASDLYLVTDGLPTAGKGGYRSLNPFAGCSALWGGSATISGECRIRLFRHTVSNAGLGDVTANVVLLPIEGDPDASVEFWRWTAATGGLLIAPAGSWP